MARTGACDEVVVDAIPFLSSRAETTDASGPLYDSMAPPEQAPDELSPNELPDEYRAILRVLHAIPGWRVRAERERRLLDSLCAPSDGSEDGYEPAFVLRRAHDFADWWQSDERKGTPDTRFLGFMRRTQPEDHARWQTEQAQAQAQARSREQAALRYNNPQEWARQEKEREQREQEVWAVIEAERRRKEEESAARIARGRERPPLPQLVAAARAVWLRQAYGGQPEVKP